MKYQIQILQGLNDIAFGCGTDEVEKLMGKAGTPIELDDLGDQSLATLIWDYDEEGFSFFFDAGHGQPKLTTIESDNETLFLGQKQPFGMDRAEIIRYVEELLGEKAEIDTEEWGEERVSFEQSELDFFIDEGQLSVISWSNQSFF